MLLVRQVFNLCSRLSLPPSDRRLESAREVEVCDRVLRAADDYIPFVQSRHHH